MMIHVTFYPFCSVQTGCLLLLLLCCNFSISSYHFFSLERYYCFIDFRSLHQLRPAAGEGQALQPNLDDAAEKH